MKRLDFLKRISTFTLIGVPFLALAESCSTTVDPVSVPAPQPGPAYQPGPDKDCLANGTDTTIDTNHGHELTVSISDVDQGAAKTYNIAGSSSHDHQVTISEANFTSLKNNNTSIQVTSTSGSGHTHSIQVSCA